MSHLEKQKEQSEKVYSTGSRQHVSTEDAAIKHIVSWRVNEGMRRLMSASKGLVNFDSSILVLCSGEGMEGSILCDIGFTDVTVSDLAEQGVQAALNRDERLKGLVLNAENADVTKNSFDVVLVQDGLHHLMSPIQGFTEMIRLAKIGVFFLEPHDSFIGHMIGTQWEKNGSAINYVFRWDKELVEQVTSSYLGPDSFYNLSFSFWHHNLIYAKFTRLLGSALGLYVVKLVKVILDSVFGKFGNQFCGLILKR